MTMDQKNQKENDSLQKGTVSQISDLLCAIGEAFVDQCSGSIAMRLRKASYRARLLAADDSDFQLIADSLYSTFLSAESGKPDKSLSPLIGLLNLPVTEEIVHSMPEKYLPYYQELRAELQNSANALERFQEASFLTSFGPSRVVRFFESFSHSGIDITPMAIMVSKAENLRYASLIDAGFHLLRAATMIPMVGSTLLATRNTRGACTDDCTQGSKRNCQAGEIAFIPHGKTADLEDFDDMLTLISIISTLSNFNPIAGGGPSLPGGAALEVISDQLEDLQNTADRRLIQAGGYDVFVKVSFEICTKGFCKTYWEEKEKIVQVTPVDENDRHIPNGVHQGWSSHVIESLKSPSTPQAVQSAQEQFQEFKDLAEQLC
jgi:hypothetical protein